MLSPVPDPPVADAVCVEIHEAEPGSAFCFGRGGRVGLWEGQGRYWVRDECGFGGEVDRKMDLDTIRERLGKDCKTKMRLQISNLQFTEPTPPACLVDAEARVCPRCKQTAAFVESQQRRAADEGETQVLVCRMCGRQQKLER